MRRDRLLLVALCAVTFAAFAVRMFRLGTQDLWGDEAFMAWLAQRPVDGILRDLARGEPHPPLYPLALWAWVKIAGSGEFALRFPSALFGSALVPMLAIIGLRLRGRHLAIVAALVGAINPFFIWYSQETRMYVVVAFFAAWSAAVLLRGKPRWLEFALAATLMAYTHYYGLLVLAGFGLAILVAVSTRRLPWRMWLGALALMALAYLPWVAYASSIFLTYYGVAPGKADLLPVFARFWLQSIAGPVLASQEAQRWLALFLPLAVVGLVSLAGTRYHRSEQPPGPVPNGLLLLGWMLLPVLGGYAISVVRPMYAERYLIVSTVPLLILVSYGIVRLRRWRPVEALALVLVVASVLAPLRAQLFDPSYVKSEYSQHTTEVSDLASPQDAVILDGASQSFLFDYYYRGPLRRYPIPRDTPMSEPATEAELALLVQRHSGLWVFLYATHDYDPGDFVEKWLSQHAFRAWHTWTINGRLVYYATYPRGLSLQGGTARFGDSLELRQFSTRVQPYIAGQVVPLQFRWRAEKPLDKDLKLSLRLRDAEGFLWGQTDAEPVSGFRPTRTWKAGEDVEDRAGVLIVPGTPPGTYSLELRVYPAGGNPLPAQAFGLAADGPAVTLGEIVVDRAGRQAVATGIPAFRTIGASFEQEIFLEGESAVGEVTAGENVYLTTMWRALKKPAADYQAFLQLIDKRGRVAAEAATPPYNGSFGPARWQEGDAVRWQHNLRVPAATPPGDYELMLSLRAPSGAALSAQSKTIRSVDAVVLQKVVVKR